MLDEKEYREKKRKEKEKERAEKEYENWLTNQKYEKRNQRNNN